LGYSNVFAKWWPCIHLENKRKLFGKMEGYQGCCLMGYSLLNASNKAGACLLEESSSENEIKYFPLRRHHGRNRVKFA